ncbi:MAG: TlpA family protein disulfide reductase [Planctomycetes bacterium]|nr:TlpA family protein disulfide reductase [Planctomycetota bacterium]
MKLTLTPGIRLIPALAVCAALLAPYTLARAEDPPKPEVSEADKARERELLDQSFKSLEEELKAMLEEFSREIQAANANKIPREEWPKSPAGSFYPRFESLALRGQPDSLRWCIGIMPSIELPIDERNSKRDALYKCYVAQCVDSTFTPDIIGFIATEGSPVGLGVDRVVPFLDQIAKSAKKEDVRVQAMWTKADLYRHSDKPAHSALAIASYKALMTVYPKSAEAARAKGLVFQLERLQVGMTAPDVATVDLDGKNFKLSDTRGQVTLVLFFGSGHRATQFLLPQFKELQTTFKDKPFTIVGVTNDTDKDAFKKFMADAGIDWKISWQGGPQGPWIEQWGIARWPTVFVLDERGVIRLVNVEPPAIKAGVEQLFADNEAKKNAAK